MAEKLSWRERNPEKYRESQKAWRERNHEKIRESQKAWRERNHEKIRENKKAWRERNPEKARNSWRVWRERNPEKARESRERWRERNPEKARAIHQHAVKKYLAKPGNAERLSKWRQAYWKEYFAANKERIKAVSRAYYQKNRLRILAARTKKREMK